MFRRRVTTLANSSTRSRSGRMLRMENLEPRLALSGLPEIAAGLPAPVPNAEDPTALVYSVPFDANSTATSLSESASISTSVTTSEANTSTPDLTIGDREVAGVGVDGLVLAPMLGPPGGGTPPNLAPQVVDFTASLENGTWYFRGSILDDTSAAGMTVYFTGILTAQTTTDGDGQFEFAVADSLLGLGWVYAHAIDSDNLSSDYEHVTIDV